MKCINDKCENGLWSEDGCLFPEGTICSGFIPESEKTGVVPVDSQSTGSVPMLTLEMVNALQDEAHKTYRKHQAGGIRGQTMTMYDMWDYHLIMATQKFMEQNEKDQRRERS